jgi:hypothetical protein
MENMKYKVEIVETLSKVVSVNAASEEEAVSRIQKKYREGKIVLYPEDFMDVNFDSINI